MGVYVFDCELLRGITQKKIMLRSKVLVLDLGCKDLKQFVSIFCLVLSLLTFMIGTYLFGITMNASEICRYPNTFLDISGGSFLESRFSSFSFAGWKEKKTIAASIFQKF